MAPKLAHVQVVINCLYFVAQMCTCKDMLAHSLGASYLDDVMSQNELTTMCFMNSTSNFLLLQSLARVKATSTFNSHSFKRDPKHTIGQIQILAKAQPC